MYDLEAMISRIAGTCMYLLFITHKIIEKAVLLCL